MQHAADAPFLILDFDSLFTGLVNTMADSMKSNENKTKNVFKAEKYWPSQGWEPDQSCYAIYLIKRSFSTKVKYLNNSL